MFLCDPRSQQVRTKVGATPASSRRMRTSVRLASFGCAALAGALWSAQAVAQAPVPTAPASGTVPTQAAGEGTAQVPSATTDAAATPSAPAADATIEQPPEVVDSSESLATPELVIPEPTVKVVPAVVAVNLPAVQVERAVRRTRRLAVLGEIGWNSLSGWGANLTFHAHPHVSLDLGAGFSVVGNKVGLRARANLLKSPVTPFIGVGGMLASGLGDKDSPQENIKTENVTVFVRPSAFAQAVVGVDWTSRGGFTLVAATGYAWLIGGRNWRVASGTPTDEEREAFNVIFGSSPVVSLAMGYSFR